MTNNAKQLRKMSNMRLTRKFHFPHMGLWIAACSALVVVLNFLLYIVILQQWRFSVGASSTVTAVFAKKLGIFMSIEAIALCCGIVFMAKATSHRIAGPYVGLQRTCERIRNGERDLRQKFRGYDYLTELEVAFNTMLDELVERRDQPEQQHSAAKELDTEMVA
jgi:hypothetical protein